MYGESTMVGSAPLVGWSYRRMCMLTGRCAYHVSRLCSMLLQKGPASALFVPIMALAMNHYSLNAERNPYRPAGIPNVLLSSPCVVCLSKMS